MDRVPVPSGGGGGHLARALAALLAVALIFAAGSRLAGQIARTGWTVVAWNNLGMHCMDADFSVFAILPPYNTIQAQVLDQNGHLVTSDTGVRVTYQGIADATNSINTTSAGKTNFWTYVLPMFGVAPPVNTGLTNGNGTYSMPGTGNPAQAMRFDSTLRWFIAEGIPITPYDDSRKKNYYPLMKVTATDTAGTVLASTNIVLPVSDEMDCRVCHGSGSASAARPAAGWVYEPDVQRDQRLNILRLHDERSGTSLFASAMGGKPVLCASCHKSEALPGTGAAGVLPLTSSMHTLHARVVDPSNGLTLDSSANRGACYRCHPGSETRCLRGAMGNSVAANGSMAIQCQNCHGSMSMVGEPPPNIGLPPPNRTGWFDEPNCQACHTGTATSNSGAIRYTSVFDSTGQMRVPTNTTFATNPNTPVANVSLYRFSSGHGGLQCSACHGSTHAEFPSSHPNDNLQSVNLQGHVGTIVECGTCHTAGVPMTANGGPHGMHPVGGSWVSGHHDYINGNLAQCQACHGTDYRGTVLSRAAAARTFTTELGTKKVFRGAQVGCYMCHNGPFSSSATSNRAPVASNATATATSPTPVSIPLSVTDADGNALSLRIVSQPTNGTVGISGTTATYFPYVGSSGTDTFTYAAWDGSIDSNLATVTVSVTAAACTVAPTATVPSSAAAGTSVSFASTATTGSNCAGAVAYTWNFGDGTQSSYQNAVHTYTAPGPYAWSLTATVGGVASMVTGSINVGSTTCTVSATATGPTTGTVGTAVAFSSTVTNPGCSGGVTYDWNFGDGTPHGTTQNPTHTYTAANTYTWSFLASSGGVTSASRSGSITVSAAPTTSAPTITSTVQLSNPFRVQVNGTNFQVGVTVFIGADTTPWAYVTRVSSSQLVLGGGSALRNKFPRNRAVAIKVVNPDGQVATGTFTRR